MTKIETIPTLNKMLESTGLDPAHVTSAMNERVDQFLTGNRYLTQHVFEAALCVTMSKPERYQSAHFALKVLNTICRQLSHVVSDARKQKLANIVCEVFSNNRVVLSNPILFEKGGPSKDTWATIRLFSGLPPYMQDMAAGSVFFLRDCDGMGEIGRYMSRSADPFLAAEEALRRL